MSGGTSALAASVLREIAERLAALANGGESAAIDLRSLPLTAFERGELERSLGRGEVAARLTVAGTSEIWETSYRGVWWIRHFGAGEHLASERIEITAVPEILVTDPADLAESAARANTLVSGSHE